MTQVEFLPVCARAGGYKVEDERRQASPPRGLGMVLAERGLALSVVVGAVRGRTKRSRPRRGDGAAIRLDASHNGAERLMCAFPLTTIGCASYPLAHPEGTEESTRINGLDAIWQRIPPSPPHFPALADQAFRKTAFRLVTGIVTVAFLTRNGGSHVFQIRVPRRFDPLLVLAPIRLTLGSLPNSQARLLATALAGLAQVEFARRMAEVTGQTPETVRDDVARSLKAAMPVLLGLGALKPGTFSPAIAEKATTAAFDALIEIGGQRAAGRGVFANERIHYEKPFARRPRYCIDLPRPARRQDPGRASVGPIPASCGYRSGTRPTISTKATIRF